MSTQNKDLRCGLIGEHLGHSFSPIIHSQLANYSYELFELVPSELKDFMSSGRLDAFNVTIPYKKAVMPYLDEISDEALLIGAVNTVVKKKDGKLIGYNTDYFGFSYMIDVLGVEIKGKSAIVLGSGGASATVCAVLSDRGASKITVISRGGKDNYENLHLHYGAEIIVNATPLGMYPNNGISPIDLKKFTNCKAVFDLIYNPSRTRLLLDAKKLGIPHINGLSMLVAQAAKASEFFTGNKVDGESIKKIIEDISAKTENIILIGMPGCGKTTVGKILAEQTDRKFIDADEEFSKHHSMTPAEAITSLGEERFRELEHETLSRICKESSAVIATGGGVVTREYNYDLLHQNGRIVYILRDIDKLSREGRPLSQNSSLQKLFEARKDAYIRFSDIMIESTEIPELTAKKIIDAINKKETE